MSTTALKKKIEIDYPKQNERITSAQYTFRINAPIDGGERVEISVDGDAPQACRSAAGFWWFDWQGEEQRQHRLSAKIVSAAGEVVAEAARRFQFALPEGEDGE
jgi:hypothetical protein